MPSTKYSITNTNYRYGVNRKENDNDIENGAQDYGARIYDGRLGRFLSVDPITEKYPELSPYQFASNTPIFGIDRDGKELWGNDWLFNIRVDWISGDPIGVKSMKDGFEEKAAIQTRQMSYHNDEVPTDIQNKLDYVNNIDANIKIAKGTAKLVTFNIKTSFDVMSSIAPIGEGGEIIIQGIQELNRAKFAMNFYKEAGYSKAAAVNGIKGIDLSEKVFELHLKRELKLSSG